MRRTWRRGHPPAGRQAAGRSCPRVPIPMYIVPAPDLCIKGLGCPWDVAPPPKQFDAWTPQMRREQIARLEAAREHDRAAVAAIETALEAAT